MTVNICLAPLKGVTDAIFRTAYAEFFSGIDWAIAPFLTTIKGTCVKPSHLRQVLPENNRQMPVVPQIISKTAGNFILLAQALFDLGYSSVNWNLGCPYPMVARKGRGSGMLPNPESVTAFLDQALPAMTGRLSIKMRLGRHGPDEIETLLPLLNDYPLDSITIHPRTGVQMYSGRPNLEVFEKCLTLTRHRVIYNGDIVSRAGFVRLQMRFPQINTWMIGRGAIKDPFLPAAIKGQSDKDQVSLQRFRGFHDALFARYRSVLYGPSHLLGRMKGLWSYFINGFQDDHKFRKKILRTQTVDHYHDVVNRFFDGRPDRKKDCEAGD